MAPALVKLRLRSLLDKDNVEVADKLSEDGGPVEAREEIMIEGSAELREWLIVRTPQPEYGGAEHQRQLRRFQDVLRKCFGPKVLVLSGDVEFCVFEPVEEPEVSTTVYTLGSAATPTKAAA